MHVTNALTRSLLLHALLLVLISVQAQNNKPIKTPVPLKWVMDVKVVLQERELQLPRQGGKDVKTDMPPTVKSRVKAVANSKPAVEDKKSEDLPKPVEAAPADKSAPVDSGKAEEGDPAVAADPQAMARQMQQAFGAQMNAQFMLMHMSAFFKGARLSTQAFINSGTTEESREKLNGKTAFVKLLYQEDGTLENVEVSSESDELKSLLENVSWKAVPLPKTYYLPYRGIGMQIEIRYGNPRIGIKVLP